MNARFASGAIKLNETRPVSDGRQIFDTNPTLWPLNKPTPKIEALVSNVASNYNIKTSDFIKVRMLK